MQPLVEMGDVIEHLSHSWGNFGSFQLGFLTLSLLHLGKWKKKASPQWEEEEDEVFAPGLGKPERVWSMGAWRTGGA